jgi:hypothetical protein
MRRTTQSPVPVALAALLALAGCNGMPIAAAFDGSIDFGPHDAAGDGAPVDGAPSDGAPADGAPSDGGTPDGAPADGTMPDGTVPTDGSAPDGTVPTDGSAPDGTVPTDGAAPDAPCPGACTTDAECPPIMRCIDGAMCPGSTRHCELRGRLCSSSLSCGAGETCDATGHYCVTTDGSECASPATCPLGYLCEADAGGVRHCIDRRSPCVLGSTGCPRGFSCLTGFCVRATGHCVTEMDCAVPVSDCADVDGDGMLDCIQSGTACTVNADCPGETCDWLPGNTDTVCGHGGFCTSDGVCGTGAHCVDVHEDGFRQCLPTTGTCAVDADCPAPQLCSDWGSGMASCR